MEEFILIEYIAAGLGWLLKRLPYVIIVGMLAFLPNFRVLIEGDDKSARSPRIIVACAMLAALIVTAFIKL